MSCAFFFAFSFLAFFDLIAGHESLAWSGPMGLPIRLAGLNASFGDYDEIKKKKKNTSRGNVSDSYRLSLPA